MRSSAISGLSTYTKRTYIVQPATASEEVWHNMRDRKERMIVVLLFSGLSYSALHPSNILIARNSS